MIFKTDLNAMRTANYEATIKNLEKAKELLDQRFAKKEISNEDYIRKAKDIEKEIAKYKSMIGQD